MPRENKYTSTMKLKIRKAYSRFTEKYEDQEVISSPLELSKISLKETQTIEEDKTISGDRPSHRDSQWRKSPEANRN